MAERSRLNQEGVLLLDQPLLKTSVEQLKKCTRNSQKWAEKGVLPVIDQIAAVCEKETDKNVIKTKLKELSGKLEGVRRKLAESKADENIHAEKCRARLDHLNELSALDSAISDSFTAWNRKRLYRVLVDYLLRNGYHESAECLAKISDTERLVDLELMQEARRIEEALARGSCAECIKWCDENKSALKKTDSQLEFNLRLQEYVELVRVGQISNAMVYLRKHLNGFSDTKMKELQEAAILLAYNPRTVDLSDLSSSDNSTSKYQDYFQPERWTNLILQFRRDHYALLGLSNQAQLVMSLQAGLSALKTPFCYDSECFNVNCPTCDSRTYGHLATGLPFAHHVNSCIVCRISGDIMNENNPPMVLPNGMVYSQKALAAIAEARGDNKVEDPRTKQVFDFSMLRRVHVLT